MMSALVIGAEAATAAHLHQLCLQTHAACLYRTLERYPQLHETARLLNSFSPELVFLGSDDEQSAREVERDIRTVAPGTAVLGISARMNGLASVESTYGGFSVLGLPCEPDQFRSTVFDVMQRGICQKGAPVFAFQTAKGGSGSTTTALVVARILATLAGKRVLVMECDLDSGPISLIHNLRPNYSILDALEECHRLTDEHWKQMVVNVDGVDLLSSLSPSRVREPSPWDFQRLLAFVRSRYDMIIADLPEVINDASEVIARSAGVVFIVTGPSSPALYLAARRRYQLESRGLAATKVRYIVNRKSGDRALPRDAGWAIDAEKIAAIPFDPGLADACELSLKSVAPATLGEFAKVAEFCCGRTLLPKRAGFRFRLGAWVRGSSPEPELYSTAMR